jgi:PAS domain S-box-containing protein
MSRFFTPTLRITLSILGTTIGLVLAAHALGLLADAANSELQRAQAAAHVRPVQLLALIGFLGVAGLFAYYFVLSHALKEFDPSNVIPDRVKTAFDTLAEGVVIMDQRGRIVLANTAFLDVVGKRLDTLVGTSAGRLPATDWETGNALDEGPWQQVCRTGKTRIGASLGLMTATGERRRFIVNVGPIMDDKGHARGAIATFDDVTELDKKNRELAVAVSQLQDFSAHLEDRVQERTTEAEQAASEAR